MDREFTTGPFDKMTRAVDVAPITGDVMADPLAPTAETTARVVGTAAE